MVLVKVLEVLRTCMNIWFHLVHSCAFQGQNVSNCFRFFDISGSQQLALIKGVGETQALLWPPHSKMRVRSLVEVTLAGL